MSRSTLRSVVLVSALAGATVAPLAAAGAAAAKPSRVYVSAHASTSGTRADGDDDRRSCEHAAYSSIQAAVEGVALGGQVVVCPGTYRESVTVDRRITLEGRRGAIIDATGQPYGVGVTASWSTIRGLTVQNAGPLNPDAGQLADGIVTAGFTANGPVAADHVTIEHNRVTGNLGSGIDLNSTSHSVARHNMANGNGVGINVADDLGRPAAHNRISYNVTNTNFGGCGIALADHTGAGVIGNVVTHNVSDDNGLSTPTAPDASAGSGVILASPIPGGSVSKNLIAFNRFKGNGHGGVVVHSHVPNLPGNPPSDFTGNVVTGNLIGTNNLRTDTSDLETTGIYLGSASPLSITVSRNVIYANHFGIFTAGDVTLTGRGNLFIHVAVRVGGVATY